MEPKDRLIVALDVSIGNRAVLLASVLKGSIGLCKVGYRLFLKEGPRIVYELISSGHKVFLDLKFHDTADTLGPAVSDIPAGVSMFTVHASGGISALEAAVQNRGEAEVYAVAVLSSLGDRAPRVGDRPDVLLGRRNLDKILQFARLAHEAGCQGIICPSWAVGPVRKVFNRTNLKIAAVGIRKFGTENHNHQETFSPGSAILMGADYEIVGRPIIEAPDPEAVAREFVRQIARKLP